MSYWRATLLCACVVALFACIFMVGYEAGEKSALEHNVGEYLDGKVCYPTRQP